MFIPSENEHLAETILGMFAFAAFVILVQMVIACYCASKRLKFQRAPNWLEIIAGYSKEQRNRSHERKRTYKAALRFRAPRNSQSGNDLF